MKNKTSRAKSMKLKKAIAASLAISILFSFTGCGTSSGSATTESSKRSLPTGKPDLCRSQKCMGQSIWFYEQEH